jgi:hypothetical protein
VRLTAGCMCIKNRKVEPRCVREHCGCTQVYEYTDAGSMCLISNEAGMLNFNIVAESIVMLYSCS